MSNQSVAQTERLRKYLATGNTINPLQAWRDLGIYRLAARVHELKAAGNNVGGDFIEAINTHGEPCRVKRYWLEASQ